MSVAASPLCLKKTLLKVGRPKWSDDVDSESSGDDADFKRQQSSDGVLSVRSKVESNLQSEAPTMTWKDSDTQISSSGGDHASVLTPRELAATGGGLSGCTTAMLRNVPLCYSQHGLMAELNRAGFVGSFDFFYLPLALRSKRNRGFAFINFLEPELAEKFYTRYHGRFLRNFQEPASEPLLILPADVQGFEASAQAARANRQPQSAPVLLRALPDPEDFEEDMSLEELARRAKSWELDPQHEFFRTLPPSLPQWSERFSRAAVVLEPRFCTFCGGARAGRGCFCPYCGHQLTLHGGEASASVTDDSHCQT